MRPKNKYIICKEKNKDNQTYRDWEVLASKEDTAEFIPFAEGLEDIINKFINRSQKRVDFFNKFAKDLIILGNNSKYLYWKEVDGVYNPETKTMYRRTDAFINLKSKRDFEVMFETFLHETAHHVWYHLPFIKKIQWHWYFWTDKVLRYQYFNRLNNYRALKREEEAFCIVISDYYMGREEMFLEIEELAKNDSDFLLKSGCESSSQLINELPSTKSFEFIKKIGLG